MTRHIATFHVTDSNHAVHDLITIECERDEVGSLPDSYRVTRFDSNGKREWNFWGHMASDEAIAHALSIAAFGDWKKDTYDEA